MRFLTLAVAIIAAALLAAPANASDASLKRTFLRGATHIRTSKAAQRMHDQLVVTRATLRADRWTTARGRRGKTLAIQGFTYWIKGAEKALQAMELASQDDPYGENVDELMALATEVNRLDKTGAALLKAAGRSLRVRVRLGHGF